METHLHALYKATNYSIRVLAYTKGDGVPSDAKYCSTEEDGKLFFYQEKKSKIFLSTPIEYPHYNASCLLFIPMKVNI